MNKQISTRSLSESKTGFYAALATALGWRALRIVGMSGFALAILWGHGGSAAHAATPATYANKTIPLAEHPQGQKMMMQAAQDATLIGIDFKFLDKTYKNDVYVREPITGKKARVSCRRFKGVSGF